MKTLRLLGTVLLATIFVAPAAFAVNTVLTADGVLYTVAPAAEDDRFVVLSRREGEVKTSIAVPATFDDAREADVQLDYDLANDRVYVSWKSVSDDGSALMVSSFDAEHEWTEALTIARADRSEKLGELRLVLTRSKRTEVVVPEEGSEETEEGAEPETIDIDVTLLHAAWWRQSGKMRAEYALVAFEGAEHVSTSVHDLIELSAVSSSGLMGPGEEMGEAIYPPLAMEPLKSGVDVVFGAENSTRLTRVQLTPKPNARLWRPGRSGSVGIPPAQIVSANAHSVQAYLAHDRVVLYTPDGDFRFVVYVNGKWSPVRTIALDETLTREQILGGLYRMGGQR